MQVSQTRFLLDCVVSLLLVSSVFALSDLSDIPGRFCEGRRVPCCDARQDACSVPIRGTLCYCDQFCDRPFNDDCCPDYQYVCLNRTRPLPPLPDFSTTPRPTPRPTRSCWYKQQFYPEGYTFRDNCNRCLCEYQCRGRDCRGEMVCERNRCLVDPDLLTEVNQGRYGGWRAANYSEFWGRTLEEGLTLRLGTKHSRKRAYSMRTVKDVFDRERVRARLRYDLRSERPDMISTPLDQGWCAADWVISTVQIATDRLMMMSKGRDHTVLSPQHLLSCNKNQQGCRGGRLTKAWIFINKFGLVPDNCYRWVGNQTNCAIAKHKEKTYISTPCADGNSFGPLHRTGPVYRISNEPEAIMNEILVSGPVQATMKVSQDFFVYRSGIYQCPRASRSSKASSYHSVRIVGWGEEVQQGSLVQYWIVSNSWGTWWGEGGFFRIVRGKDECEIESLILASWANPILPKEDPFMPMPEKNNIINNFLSKF